MPASITPKFQRYNKVTITDGTAVTPLSFELTQWEGVFSYTEPEDAQLVAYNQNDFAAVVKGQVQMKTLTFTVNMKAFTLTDGTDDSNLQNELEDVLKFRALTGWAAAVSTGAASFTNINMVDIAFELSLGTTHGETANPVKTFRKAALVSIAGAAGDPNTQVYSLNVYGAIEDTGQDEVP